MASIFDYFTQGTRIFLTSYKSRLSPEKFDGDAKEICGKIVSKCWNGRYFQTSTNNFSQFWTRDFGWCTYSLLKLNYKDEVHQTLRYALNRFRSHKKITTTITPHGKPFDFPDYASDSLPWLIHSIVISQFPYYSYKNFLNKEIRKYFNKVVDPNTGLVKPDKIFSSMKDFSIRRSSCYDNCMVGMLAKDLKRLKLDNPFLKYKYPELIKRHFWNDKFFKDDLSKKEYVAGDANIFPFLTGLCKDEEMLKSAFNTVREAELDKLMPLRYTNNRKGKFIWQEIFLMNYESDSIWTHMGPLYIKLMQQIDKKYAEELKKSYTEMIEKHGNYLEVFFTNGEIYGTPFYYCDRGMLWAVNYLTL